MSARTILLAAAVVIGVGIFAPFTYYYVKVSRIVDEKLRSGPFANASNIYAAARRISVGEKLSSGQITADLRRAGYTEGPSDGIGWFRRDGPNVEIHPGAKARGTREAAVLRLSGDAVSGIQLVTGSEISEYDLQPEVLTNFVDENRERRQMVRYGEIPKVLVNALISAEDKRFFEHAGFDPFRIVKAAYIDLREHRKEQGASTITMQLARGLWLEPQKAWRRKATEILIASQLEHKLTKPQILEYYCNQVYLGRRDTFSIHGFGEAAQAYFSKQIGDLTLPEAATLAGMVQRPAYYNPFRYPARILARRNTVLSLMKQNRYISEADYESARQAPLGLSPRVLDSGGAPYFMALVNDELQTRLPDNARDGDAYEIFTTLDWNLQNAAQAAVEMGMKQVDEQLARKRKKKHSGEATAKPQVALVALDPHTGYIKALVGGRNYAQSQLNHALSNRQPGSVFKPFVYAAALNTAVEGKHKMLFTPITTVDDEPTTFKFGNDIYEPNNFHNGYYGTVTLRRALAHSMNIATVRLAEQVGYANVVKMAKKCGLNENIHATPAVALGAYEATPLEMAGAYTVYANKGLFVKPTFLAAVRSKDGKLVLGGSPESHQALDPRVTYLMVNMLEEVMRSGTAAGVRGRGFRAPAAGKTGTSRDGWFAGFTSDLLCVVWVGFDDNRELDLEGARSALPIWTEFMKRALTYGERAVPFQKPPGVIAVNVDSESGMLAGPECGPGRTEFFIPGTQPKQACEPSDIPVTDPFQSTAVTNPPNN